MLPKIVVVKIKRCNLLQLVYLLQREEHEQTHEHLAKALLTLLRDNKPVVDEVLTIKDLEDFIKARLV